MRVLRWIDHANTFIGKTVSYFVWLGMGIIVIEVIGRYVFNSPSVWAPGYTQRIFAAYFILIGAFTLIRGGHVRVDIFLNTRSARWNALTDLLNFVILIIWTGAMTYEAWYLLVDAWTFNELDDSALRHPMWPVNLALFLGVLLMTIQGIAGALRSLILLIFPKTEVEQMTMGGSK